jgi:pterin-4a-carbinolamine dehydratase
MVAARHIHRTHLRHHQLCSRCRIRVDDRYHHPDVDLRYRTVVIRLTTNDLGGLTELDFALAQSLDLADL